VNPEDLIRRLAAVLMPFVMGLTGFKRPISADMPRDPSST
jgi:hypothetical protein